MRKQNDISSEAFGLLADLIGGHTLRFAATESSPRRCIYAVDGKEIDPAIVRLLRDINGQSAIWPSHFDNLDDAAIQNIEAHFKAAVAAVEKAV